jgi:dihydroxy-acid dehydratase
VESQLYSRDSARCRFTYTETYLDRYRKDDGGKSQARSHHQIPDGAVVLQADSSPLSTDVGITILGGTLAPEGAVSKTAGIGIESLSKAQHECLNANKLAMEALENGTIQAGDVVVIRYEGPKGGPGMREMLMVTGAIKGAGLR